MKKFTENTLDINRLPLLETLMTLGNGYIGSRGYLEEFDYPGSIRGNYINGIYERIPMEHAEWAHGFPRETDRMPNLLDLFKITIFLDGEEVKIQGDITDFTWELDFENGIRYRRYKYITKNNKIGTIQLESLISLSHIQHRSWTLNIDFPGKIEVINNIDFNISNVVSKHDPRLAPKDFSLVNVVHAKYDSNRGNIGLETINSRIKIDIDFKDKGNFNNHWDLEDNALNIYFLSNDKLEINRMVKYKDSIRNIDSNFIPKDKLYKEQKEHLKIYNENTSIEFLDNKELSNLMDFMRFHILQATSQDEYGNIAAKGLSGEGYEGHYFWDTEIFLFPVWLLWDKTRAKNLLLYRYRLLDIARSRAIEMGHSKGACFSWRTISGIESSGFFPAGSAQFHINFDIAYTFIQWWLATKDMEFLANYSMELLLETARTALEIGNFRADGFHIHTVTGPDEYTALVSNNYYTNKMAQYNLKWAVKLWERLKEERYSDWEKIKNKLDIKDEEIKEMEKAAKDMILIYNDKMEIIAQDATFLDKAKWPKENTLRPLLLNYHPLTIYRYQVLKQADVILALYLLGDVEEDIVRRSFYYYEDINTHDSSLSKSISGIMASKLKDEKLAYDFFMDSVYMDLKDLHHNTKDGLHMANIGGSLLSILGGFGGLKIKEDGLHVNPYVPKKLGRLKFRFTWQKTVLEILIEGEKIDIKKISGPSLTVILRGEKILVGKKAVLFDLDGVLTGTSDNHYLAWRRLMKDLGYDLPEEFRHKLRGISRMESMDLILNYFGLEYSQEKKLKLTDIKNEYYKNSIESFTSENLYPGVIELLDRLKAMGVKIGLVSASNNAIGLIKNMGIEKYFHAIADPKNIARGKPYPDPFIKAAEMLKVDPVDCLGIEDAVAGIDSINAAKMTSLGIGSQDLKKADYQYKTILDASEFIIKWVEGYYGRD